MAEKTEIEPMISSWKQSQTFDIWDFEIYIEHLALGLSLSA